MRDVFTLRLRNAPIAVKAMALGYVLALSLAYLYAIINIAIVIGLTPKHIAIHYYGSDVSMEHKVQSDSAGEQSLDLNAVQEQPSVAANRPSFKNLIAEGHFHLFGMSSFFFGLTLMGLFTSLPEKWKIALVGAPYLAIIADNVSFMATRFLGPKFAYLTAGSGAIMGLCFTALWIAIVFEIISKPEAK